MKTRFLKDNQGSFTVEASILMSTIIIVLSLLILSLMFLYQKVLLNYTAVKIAQQAAFLWADRSIEDFKEPGDGLYDGLNALTQGEILLYQDKVTGYLPGMDFSDSEQGLIKSQDKKTQKLKEGLYGSLAQTISKPHYTFMEIKLKRTLFSQQITVLLRQELAIPLGTLKKFYDGKGTVSIEATGISHITQPTEWVRNIDLGLEYGRKLADKINKAEDLVELIHGK